jgi:sugar-specific transcriptional regulator TrmB
VVANDFSLYCRRIAKGLFSIVAKLEMMEKRKFSHKQNLSADAKLIIALLKKQPQTKSELCKNAGVHISTFYRILPLLERHGVIKETSEGFALWTYIELKKDVENTIDKLEGVTSVIALNKIASEVGIHPSKIERIIYSIAKERGMEVRLEKGEKVIARKTKGVVLF